MARHRSKATCHEWQEHMQSDRQRTCEPRLCQKVQEPCESWAKAASRVATRSHRTTEHVSVRFDGRASTAASKEQARWTATWQEIVLTRISHQVIQPWPCNVKGILGSTQSAMGGLISMWDQLQRQLTKLG